MVQPQSFCLLRSYSLFPRVIPKVYRQSYGSCTISTSSSTHSHAPQGHTSTRQTALGGTVHSPTASPSSSSRPSVTELFTEPGSGSIPNKPEIVASPAQTPPIPPQAQPPFHTHAFFTKLETTFPTPVAEGLMHVTKSLLVEKLDRVRKDGLTKKDLDNVRTSEAVP